MGIIKKFSEYINESMFDFDEDDANEVMTLAKKIYTALMNSDIGKYFKNQPTLSGPDETYSLYAAMDEEVEENNATVFDIDIDEEFSSYNTYLEGNCTNFGMSMCPELDEAIVIEWDCDGEEYEGCTCGMIYSKSEDWWHYDFELDYHQDVERDHFDESVNKLLAIITPFMNPRTRYK